jgi:gluconolactonase
MVTAPVATLPSGPPMTAIIAHDRRFEDLIIGHAQLEKLYTGCRWAEGPAYFPAGRYLVWSDIPNDRLMRFDETDGSVSVFMRPCNHHNGHTRDREGRLVSCEHRGRCVSRIEHDGTRTVLADSWNGLRLNSPNDVVVRADGSIWFTDPTYGIDCDYEGETAVSEIGASNVYRIDPLNQRVDRMITDRVRPNGLAFSPDERTLYVADTGRSHVPGLPATITAYPVAPDGLTAGDGRLFATCPEGFFDGFRVDDHGNLWTSAGRSVFAFAPDGTHLGTIAIGELVANVCFGGLRRNRLFICAQTSLYALFLKVTGH